MKTWSTSIKHENNNQQYHKGTQKYEISTLNIK